MSISISTYLIHIALQSTMEALNVQAQIVQIIRLVVQRLHKLAHQR